MPLKSYLVAPYNSGLQDNIEPWLLPEDAFPQLQNAYVWRGRIRKKFGTQFVSKDQNDLNSRLRVNLGNTDGSGNISVTVPGATFKVGQMFSIGSEIFTVNATGTPASLLDTGAATTKTFNTSTGALVINGAAATTAVYFYPAEPVMGLRLRENDNVNFEDLIAFDTQFAYQRSGGAWTRIGTGASATWTGDATNFFWSCNYFRNNQYDNYFYTVNYDPSDNIRYIQEGSTTWNNLQPQTNAGGDTLDSAKILLPYKDRLICLNTKETVGASARIFVNRCRFSANGSDPTAANSWRDDIVGQGGYIDAPTKEAIITADFIKDQLIVYFERSTWALVYIGDFQLPFKWQLLNNELGAESTFSVVGFDRGVLGFGNVGIHSCNGVNVDRIDDKIPKFIFDVQNESGSNKALTESIYGIRDFYNELVYWAYPAFFDDNASYPTNILVYNYVNNSWAIFDESATCFGYFQVEDDETWATTTTTWAQTSRRWRVASQQSGFPNIIMGNQEGFTFLIDAKINVNEQSLQITDIDPANSQLTIVDHNLQIGDYIRIEEAQGFTSWNNQIYQVVAPFVSSSVVNIDAAATTGTYTGGGKVRRISKPSIYSKQFNPGTPVGQQFRMPYIDFLLNRTEEGELTLNYYIDANDNFAISDQSPTSVLLGDNTLPTTPNSLNNYEQFSDRLWHRFYLQSQGQTIQFQITLSDSQMRDYSKAGSDIVINGMILYVEPSGRIIG